MANINASVGKGGKNQKADVVIVQNLLNDHITQLIPLRFLKEDGLFGPATERAITEFQRRACGMAGPDGRIDPTGRTLRTLSPLTRLPEILVPYRPGHGLYVYTKSGKLHGTPATIASVQKLAREISGSLGVEIGVGDISLELGGKMPGHNSHRKGTDVDIRPLRADGKHLPVTINDAKSYSRDRTKKVVEALRKDPNLKVILFNDRNISGVKSYDGHDNHLHVRFKQ